MQNCWWLEWLALIDWSWSSSLNANTLAKNANFFFANWYQRVTKQLTRQVFSRWQKRRAEQPSRGGEPRNVKPPKRFLWFMECVTSLFRAWIKYRLLVSRVLSVDPEISAGLNPRKVCTIVNSFQHEFGFKSMLQKKKTDNKQASSDPQELKATMNFGNVGQMSEMDARNHEFKTKQGYNRLYVCIEKWGNQNQEDQQEKLLRNFENMPLFLDVHSGLFWPFLSHDFIAIFQSF